MKKLFLFVFVIAIALQAMGADIDLATAKSSAQKCSKVCRFKDGPRPFYEPVEH